MTAIILPKIQSKFLVVGPIYDKLDKLERAKKLANNYEFTIFNGNLCYPFSNLKEVEARIDFLEENQTSKILYNIGNYDLQLLRRLNNSNENSKLEQWLSSKSNVIIIECANQTTFIITCGGLTPTINKDNILDNIETSFVSNINGSSWHDLYYGQYGYVISNNPLSFQAPQFHRSSMRLGNCYGTATEVYAQEVDPYGLKNTILL